MKTSSYFKGDKRALASALREDLEYCLGTLKIAKDEYSRKKLNELVARNLTALSTYDKRVISLKIIGDFIGIVSTVLSQSQLYDFLMLSTAASSQGMKEHKRLSGTNDIVFKMYRDIMENYETASDSLKVNYPRIIVDVISVLNTGNDTSGIKVSIYGIYQYYLSRKSNSITTAPTVIKVSNEEVSNIVSKHMDEAEVKLNNSKLIRTLVDITARNRKLIEASLTKLNKLDTERIRNLCTNYPKIEKYCKLVASDKLDFKNEIERGSGRKLTQNQIQIAAISIRKVRQYIEDILDNKFITHASHGINHTKHNLEYGYQVMGLIDSNRRAGKARSSSTNSR
jgi:hypothetical protein